MSIRSNLLITTQFTTHSRQWARIALRLLGLIAWLLLALLSLTAAGCRATKQAPTPVATVTPFPTFTSTPIAEPTLTSVAISPQSTNVPIGRALLPAPLYFLNVDGPDNSDGRHCFSACRPSELLATL